MLSLSYLPLVSYNNICSLLLLLLALFLCIKMIHRRVHISLHHQNCCTTGIPNRIFYEHTILCRKSSQHMICEIPALWFFTHADLNAHEILCATSCNNALDSIMPAGAAFLAHTNVARCKLDIVKNNDHLGFRIQFIEINDLRHTVTT